jgi:hypothetical protein
VEKKTEETKERKKNQKLKHDRSTIQNYWYRNVSIEMKNLNNQSQWLHSSSSTKYGKYINLISGVVKEYLCIGRHICFKGKQRSHSNKSY